MENFLLILAYILITALGVSLGLWFAQHIDIDVREHGGGGNNYLPQNSQ